jgi:hypothetical protein
MMLVYGNGENTLCASKISQHNLLGALDIVLLVWAYFNTRRYRCSSEYYQNNKSKDVNAPNI